MASSHRQVEWLARPCGFAAACILKISICLFEGAKMKDRGLCFRAVASSGEAARRRNAMADGVWGLLVREIVGSACLRHLAFWEGEMCTRGGACPFVRIGFECIVESGRAFLSVCWPGYLCLSNILHTSGHVTSSAVFVFLNCGSQAGREGPRALDWMTRDDF